MKIYGINEITEDEEIRRNTVEAIDIYEAARLFKNITESNPNSNYRIFELNDLSGNYLLIGNSKNDLMYYNALKLSLEDEEKI